MSWTLARKHWKPQAVDFGCVSLLPSQSYSPPPISPCSAHHAQVIRVGTPAGGWLGPGGWRRRRRLPLQLIPLQQPATSVLLLPQRACCARGVSCALLWAGLELDVLWLGCSGGSSRTVGNGPVLNAQLPPLRRALRRQSCCHCTASCHLPVLAVASNHFTPTARQLNNRVNAT